jgi:hypothetical protein
MASIFKVKKLAMLLVGYLLDLLSDPDQSSSMLLQNVAELLMDYTAHCENGNLHSHCYDSITPIRGKLYYVKHLKSTKTVFMETIRLTEKVYWS